MIKEGQKYLITCDGWFYGQDGQSYKAAWGSVELFNDDVLGIRTNYKSSNWYAKVGNSDKFVIIAGCQIHYAVRCENPPDESNVNEYWSHEGKYTTDQRPQKIIYIAE